MISFHDTELDCPTLHLSFRKYIFYSPSGCIILNNYSIFLTQSITENASEVSGKIKQRTVLWESYSNSVNLSLWFFVYGMYMLLNQSNTNTCSGSMLCSSQIPGKHSRKEHYLPTYSHNFPKQHITRIHLCKWKGKIYIRTQAPDRSQIVRTHKCRCSSAAICLW